MCGQPVLMLEYFVNVHLWWRGGLEVSALNFQPEGQWFEPGLCRRVVSLNKKLHVGSLNLAMD